MSNFQIKPAHRHNFQAIAQFIAQTNQHPESQCIHSGEGADSIYKQMLEYDDINEICFVIAYQDEQLIGAFGSEYDESLGRSWLWGPFDPENRGPDFIESMFGELLKVLPPSIKQLDTFLNQANQKGHQFYLQQAFQMTDMAHVYIAQRPLALLSVSNPCSHFTDNQTASLITLHETTFPETFEKGQTMIDHIDSRHQIFVSAEGDTVYGYIYAKVENSSGEGYVEHLCVTPTHRGQGLGKNLLLNALQWLFEEMQVQEVGLTVRDKLANARSLYEGVGFTVKYSGIATRKYLNGYYREE